MKIQAKKYFGQNFIRDPKLIQRIVALLGNNQEALVIEIGPGTGALTGQLVEKFDQVVAIEIDQDLIPLLAQNVAHENLKILNEDILKLDLEQLIKNYKKANQEVYVISNLPYYITSEILFKTLNVSHLLTKVIFMMQKEVAKRVCAMKNENNYNNLSVAAEFYASKKYEFTVSKNKFSPVPKVDSAIISLTFQQKYQKQVSDSAVFLKFVRDLFNQRRKTILNNLTNLTKNKSLAAEILTAAKIKLTLRPENIDLVEFIQIFNIYETKK